MRFRINRRLLATLVLAFLGGTSVMLFILLGPPKLLAKSESPDFCASCHVMEEQHTAWRHSGAHRRIRCVDCHLPNGNPAEHYLWKSIDGMKDVVVFHTGNVPETIKLSSHGEKVVQANCIKCHGEAAANMDQTRKCWGCHRQLRHKLTGTIYGTTESRGEEK
ncbi:MAG: cytochrome c nitrite reductase small subunit [Deltaproteobacteria bacterium]|nr:cytochrome c nitrite reductase small subunit [Deltaproteobacteria bacterium]